ncbi:MAG: UDP-N-acetylmuramoyl-L-alanyl-D-glutamate--2,6-diaminopimelate ligase [Oscillospiraceae bacterium]|nr:UDP-N-acetylmuramoyl-L-alanyl-D-glutamate--2,6-diaminopimelate ligase [Oscillospiraceae bacterium]
MQLKDLIEGVEVLSVHADLTREITGVCYDSRSIEPGRVFVAISGNSADGESFAAEALERGAACVLCEHDPGAIPHVTVSSARRALATVSANWYGRPARELTVVGVTGTNGKTSTSYYIKHILEHALSTRVGLVGTIRNMVGEEILPAERTTPESADLQALLRRMADAGCTHAVMEVSSHALALDRVYGIPYAVGIFTNLTQDHLDFHRTMEAYCDAKALLFRQCRTGVCNADDPWRERLLQSRTCRTVLYGIEGPAELRAENICLAGSGVTYDAVGPEKRVGVWAATPGRFTVYNTLAALAACRELGVPLAAGAEALRSAAPVRGRLEPVPTHGRPFHVLIDYAHTPDALENVLTAVRAFAPGRVVALFGCGGDRDRTKRPQMGAIAARLADESVVTSDNPRTEEPGVIIRDILAGMAGCKHYTVVEDRIEAIRYALSHARHGDVIVLCGKGHEDYQVIGHTKRHLDEREIVETWFREN